MSVRETPWRLFRYRNADGSSKDWAYRHLPDGGVAICWGRTGSVNQTHTYGAAEARAILRRAQEKQRKGYVPLGNAVLRDGALEPLPAPAPSSPPRPKPSAPAVDLSQIATGQDDFWF
jgi:predicted DNA-binding WGR domain protein